MTHPPYFTLACTAITRLRQAVSLFGPRTEHAGSDLSINMSFGYRRSTYALSLCLPWHNYLSSRSDTVSRFMLIILKEEPSLSTVKAL